MKKRETGAGKIADKDFLKVEKPWGCFEQFALNRQCTVKIIGVSAGQMLSLQSHRSRDEIWVALDSGLEIEIEGRKKSAEKGDRFLIKRGMRHRLSGGASGGRVLEISLGFFDEADITRFEDAYGRAADS